VLWVALLVFGGIGGAALDQIHVQSGVLAYRHPWLWDQAWWVAPQFALACVGLFLAARSWAARTRVVGGRPARGRVAADAAWFLAAYGASGLFGRHGALLTAGYLVTWVARMAWPWRLDRMPVAVFSVLLAIGGCLYEGTLASTCAFHYTHPDLYHVPVWLAGIYLHGGPLAITLARTGGVVTGDPA
jgi:hypothetical protein